MAGQGLLSQLSQLHLCIISFTSALVNQNLVGTLDFVELVRGSFFLCRIGDFVLEGVSVGGSLNGQAERWAHRMALEHQLAMGHLDGGGSGIFGDS